MAACKCVFYLQMYDRGLVKNLADYNISKGSKLRMGPIYSQVRACM